MKNLIKKPNLYKAANVLFDADKIEAYSYSWWSFVKIIEGKVVFNSYRYSVTTAKHQSKVRRLMNELGVKIDVEVQTKESLADQSIKALKLNTAKVLIEREERLKQQRKDSYQRRKAKMKSKVETVIEAAYA